MERKICWQWKDFNDLSLVELHAILLLRAQVFVVEQNCVYQDPDIDDLHSRHLLGKDGDEIVAYIRIIRPSKCAKLKIGRVVVARTYRQYGLGKKAIKLGVEHCKKQFPMTNIYISAQVYLLAFYKELGFVTLGDIYDEDGIDHINMVYAKDK